MSEPTTLYRAYDINGQLLYVGVAKNWGRRWAQHSERAPWYGTVARLRIELLPDRESALAAELEAIVNEQPIHNVRGTKSITRSKPVTEQTHDPQDRLSQAVGSLVPASLVGSYFHSGAVPGWQGCIVAEPAPGVYLVELFSWLTGDSTSQHLVPIDRMVADGWQFYDIAEWMRNTYDHGLATRWERERDEDPKP